MIIDSLRSEVPKKPDVQSDDESDSLDFSEIDHGKLEDRDINEWLKNYLNNIIFIIISI